MTALPHTPHPWRVGSSGAVVCDQQHASNHPMQPPRDYGEGVMHSDLEFYGGYLLAESITRRADAALIALAPTAPHDCEHEGCPGRDNKRKLEAFAAVKEALSVAAESLALGHTERVRFQRLAVVRDAIARMNGTADRYCPVCAAQVVAPTGGPREPHDHAWLVGA